MGRAFSPLLFQRQRPRALPWADMLPGLWPSTTRTVQVHDRLHPPHSASCGRHADTQSAPSACGRPPGAAQDAPHGGWEIRPTRTGPLCSRINFFRETR